MPILCIFLVIFKGWKVGLLREKLSLYYFTVSLQFLAKEDQGFAILFGILVVTCIDGVFLYVPVSVLCESFPFFSFCTLSKRSVKVRIHDCHALLLSLFNFNVFYCLRRIQSYCLLSLTPHLSFLIIHLNQRHQYCLLPSPKEPPAETVSNPRTQNCHPLNLPPKPLKTPNQPF